MVLVVHFPQSCQISTSDIIEGAIYSILSLLACVTPKTAFRLYGIIPVPAWLAISGLFAYDFYLTWHKKVCD